MAKLLRSFDSINQINRLINCRQAHHLLPRVSYVQGQTIESQKSIREYFYYIDHQGFLFLDDARMKNFTSCFKEIDFIHFFFTRLRLNRTGRYQDTFPFVSPCGPERNYIRCDDLPIVFTNLCAHQTDPSKYFLEMNHSKNRLQFPFQPQHLFMDSRGRLYHPADRKYGSVGLIKSSLADQLSAHFDFDQFTRPIQFKWKNQSFSITNQVEQTLIELRQTIGQPAS